MKFLRRQFGCEDLFNAVMLDNVLDWTSWGAQAAVAFQALSAAIKSGSPTMLRTRRRL